MQDGANLHNNLDLDTVILLRLLSCHLLHRHGECVPWVQSSARPVGWTFDLGREVQRRSGHFGTWREEGAFCSCSPCCFVRTPLCSFIWWFQREHYSRDHTQRCQCGSFRRDAKELTSSWSQIDSGTGNLHLASCQTVPDRWPQCLLPALLDRRPCGHRYEGPEFDCGAWGIVPFAKRTGPQVLQRDLAQQQEGDWIATVHSTSWLHCIWIDPTRWVGGRWRSSLESAPGVVCKRSTKTRAARSICRSNWDMCEAPKGRLRGGFWLGWQRACTAIGHSADDFQTYAVCCYEQGVLFRQSENLVATRIQWCSHKLFVAWPQIARVTAHFKATRLVSKNTKPTCDRDIFWVHQHVEADSGLGVDTNCAIKLVANYTFKFQKYRNFERDGNSQNRAYLLSRGIAVGLGTLVRRN